MTDVCRYEGDRMDAIVTYCYGEAAPDDRSRFEAHLAICTVCCDEVAELVAVRTELKTWQPPDIRPVAKTVPAGGLARLSARLREVPAWAQVAAALLVLGVSAGLANLEIRYGMDGLSVRTGWMRDGGVTAPAPRENASPDAQAPWLADLVSLEARLRSDIAAAKPQDASFSTVPAAARDTSDVLKRVRALIDESEKRQQRELALRVAEVIRDLGAQRQADIVKIDRTLGAVQNNLGVEVMKDRQRLNNLLIRTSGRQ